VRKLLLLRLSGPTIGETVTPTGDSEAILLE
jgi:hypothetical protein